MASTGSQRFTDIEILQFELKELQILQLVLLVELFLFFCLDEAVANTVCHKARQHSPLVDPVRIVPKASVHAAGQRAQECAEQNRDDVDVLLLAPVLAVVF